MSARQLETRIPSPANHRVIVINGVRYVVAIRLDTDWNYIADSSNQGFDATPASPAAEVRLEQEPWLSVEVAAVDGEKN